MIDYQTNDEDSPACLICGWRDQPVSQDVQREINVSIGQEKLAVSPYLNKPSQVGLWQERAQEGPSLCQLNVG